MTPAAIIKKYIELRDWLEGDGKAVEERQKPYVDAMTLLEGMMQEHLNKNDLDNVKSEFGTAYKKTQTRVKLADRGAFELFVEGCGDLGYFTNAVSKEKITEYVTEHKAAPPGVDITYLTVVQFNRPRS